MAQQTVHILKRYLSLYQQVQHTDDPESAIFVSADNVALSQEEREERERQARIQKRKELFERMRSREPLDLPEGFPTAAEMIREDRDNRPFIFEFDGEDA